MFFAEDIICKVADYLSIHVDQIRRINFECFENLNTAVIRSMPQFIQAKYTDEIIFEDAEPDFQVFQRIKGPIWIDYPSEDTVQVKSVYLQSKKRFKV